MKKSGLTRDQFIDSLGDELSSRIAENDLKDLLVVLSTEHGRRFIWRLLDFTGIFRCSMTGNSQTFFLEGHRNIGLMIFNDIFERYPEELIKMRNEYEHWVNMWTSIAENAEKKLAKGGK